MGGEGDDVNLHLCRELLFISYVNFKGNKACFNEKNCFFSSLFCFSSSDL